MKRSLLFVPALIAGIVFAAVPAVAQVIDDPTIETETPTPSATTSPRATAAPDDTPEPSPTPDPDDPAMELPGLPPLPDPATLERTDRVRTPRTPRTPRSSRDDDPDVLPIVERSRRGLPVTGGETATFGTSGFVLVGLGAVLVTSVATIRRRRRPPVVIAPTDHGGAPPWGTESLIGW